MTPPSEEGFLQAVLELAALRGWRSFHARPGRALRGWRTAVQGDGAGFVDLLLVRGGRLIMAELKSDRGRVSRLQHAWLAALRQTAAEVHVWRPCNFPDIIKALE